jgi:polygalacturonase
VFVRDCEIVNAHTVLGIGSEISGGVKNVSMKDCTANDVFRIFYLKTNRRRGGVLSGISCENVTAKKVKNSVFEIDTDVLYEWADFPDYENRATRIEKIKAKNLKAEETKNVIRFNTDPSMPPKEVEWSGLEASKVTGKYQTGK